MDIINILIAGGVVLVISALLAIALAVANVYFEVESDDRVEQIEFLLPGYNCGACGYVSCEETAKAILNGEVSDSKLCKVITEDGSNKLKEYCKTIKNNNGEEINLK